MLKKDIARVISAKEEPYLGNRKISWQYVWKTYCLAFHGNPIVDNYKKLIDYGIGHGDELHFLKYVQKRR